MRKLLVGIACFLVAGLVLAAAAEVPTMGTMKLLVFRGLREGAPEPVKSVTSSYLTYTVTANVQAETDLAAQAARIKQVFNLKDVGLLTEAELTWQPGKPDKAFHFFQLDKTFYLVMVTPLAVGQRRFRLEVFEQNGGAKTSLLDTEISLPEKNTAVFGFADKDGNPYFLSIQTTLWPSPEVVVQGLREGDAVRATGDIQPPKLIKEVSPLYPPAARAAGVQGTVILEAQTDIYGRIASVKILRSVPMLDQAAIDAVRQWVYEPMMLNGKPRSVIFTVTVRFTSSDPVVTVMVVPTTEDGGYAVSRESFRLASYPKEALDKKLRGIVVIEATVDAKGAVTTARVTKGGEPILEKAALEGIKAHVFKPFKEGGTIKPGPVTLAVGFAMPGEGQAGVEGGVVGGVMGGVVGGIVGGAKDGVSGGVVPDDAVRCTGDIRQPKLVKEVAPVYPELARQSLVEGVVILEVMTDIYGRVASIKVLRSIPMLDQAAIDSVRQWVYEPFVFEGRKRPAIFTVTVRFTLK